MARFWLNRSGGGADGPGADGLADENDQENRQREPSRAALGSISHESAAPHAPRAPAAEAAAPRRQPPAQQPQVSSGFSIFVENEFRDGYDLDDDERRADGTLHGSEAQRTKENTIEPAKWTESALPRQGQSQQRARGRRRRAPQPTELPAETPAAAAPSIAIYEDEECTLRNEERAASIAEIAERRRLSPPEKYTPPAVALRLRQALDAPNAEQLIRDPLGRFRAEDAPAAPAAAPAAAAAAPAHEAKTKDQKKKAKAQRGEPDVLVFDPALIAPVADDRTGEPTECQFEEARASMARYARPAPPGEPAELPQHEDEMSLVDTPAAEAAAEEEDNDVSRAGAELDSSVLGGGGGGGRAPFDATSALNGSGSVQRGAPAASHQVTRRLSSVFDAENADSATPAASARPAAARAATGAAAVPLAEDTPPNDFARSMAAAQAADQADCTINTALAFAEMSGIFIAASPGASAWAAASTVMPPPPPRQAAPAPAPRPLPPPAAAAAASGGVDQSVVRGLSQLSVADGSDLTINTALAVAEMDTIFRSASPASSSKVNASPAANGQSFTIFSDAPPVDAARGAPPQRMPDGASAFTPATTSLFASPFSNPLTHGGAAASKPAAGPPLVAEPQRAAAPVAQTKPAAPSSTFAIYCDEADDAARPPAAAPSAARPSFQIYLDEPDDAPRAADAGAEEPTADALGPDFTIYEDEEPSDAPATARGLSFADFASPRAARGGSLLPALADEVRREKMEYAALFS